MYDTNSKTLGVRMGATRLTDGWQLYNNMPPYLAVSVWKRIT